MSFSRRFVDLNLNGYIYTAIQDFMIFVGIPPGTDNDFGLSLDIASISSLTFIGGKEKGS